MWKKNKIVHAAIIAAVYAVLTLALAPVSFGPVQCRVSEALCILPMFFAEAVPGLAIGCLIANLCIGSIYDIIFGTIATLVAAFGTRLCRKNKWIAMLFPVVLNAVVVGGYIGLFTGTNMAVWLCMCSVGAGEAVACYGIGMPLCGLAEKLKESLQEDRK